MLECFLFCLFATLFTFFLAICTFLLLSLIVLFPLVYFILMKEKHLQFSNFLHNIYLSDYLSARYCKTSVPTNLSKSFNWEPKYDQISLWYFTSLAVLWGWFFQMRMFIFFTINFIWFVGIHSNPYVTHFSYCYLYKLCENCSCFSLKYLRLQNVKWWIAVATLFMFFWQHVCCLYIVATSVNKCWLL